MAHRFHGDIHLDRNIRYSIWSETGECPHENGAPFGLAPTAARMGRSARVGGRRACVGETGTCSYVYGHLREPVHRRHRLGRPYWPRLQKAGLRLLGWRADLSRTRTGDGAGDLDLAQWL